MRVGSSKAGDDDLLPVRFPIAVGILHKQQIRRIHDPDPAMPDSNPTGDIQPFKKNGETIRFAIAIGVFENFHAIFTDPRFATRVFERLGDPESPPIIDRHRNGIHKIRFGCDHLNRKSCGDRHQLCSRGRIARIIRWFVLCVGNQRLRR